MKDPSYVYILMNNRNTVLYVGMTTDLKGRVWKHKQKLYDGFTKKYNIDKLVYYECLESLEETITREKQLKAGSRKKKIDLIIKKNPQFNDLYPSLD